MTRLVLLLLLLLGAPGAGAWQQSTHGGETKLHVDAAAGNVAGVRTFLLHAGAAVDALDSDGMTALHRAAASGRLEVARALLHGGADPHVRDVAEESPLDLVPAADVDAELRKLLRGSMEKGGHPRHEFNAEVPHHEDL